MAEKPKLKDSGEILESLEKKAGGPSAAEGGAQAGEPIDNDRNPLDFGKYELPKKGKKSRKKAKTPPPQDDLDDFEEVAAPLAVEIVGTDLAASVPEAEAPVAQAPAAPEAAPSVERQEATTSKRNRKARRADQTQPAAPQEDSASPDDAQKQTRPIIHKSEEAGEVQSFDFTDLEAEEREAREAEEARLEAERLEAERLEAEQREQDLETRRNLVADEEYIEEVMDHLGNQFEAVFLEEFEGKAETERQAPEPFWLKERRNPVPKQPPAEQQPELLDPAILEAEREADQFIGEFEKDVLREENREEPFRETLAQKFARERERYLKELGIAEQMEAEEKARQQEAEQAAVAAAESIRPHRVQIQPELHTPNENQNPDPEVLTAEEAPKRRLDLKIQPELHTAEPLPEARPTMQSREPEAAASPVTYTRSAAVRPQTPPVSFAAGIESAAPPVDPAPLPKRSAEELLLELARQSRVAQQRNQGGKRPQELKFSFSPAGEDAPKEEKKKRFSLASTPMSRIVLASAAICFLVLCLGLWGITSMMESTKLIEDEGTPTTALANGDILELYNSFNAESQAHYADAVIKRGGLSVSNLTVDNSLVVEDESSAAGTLTLRNVMVGDLLYVKSGGTNVLDLQDVHAKHLVVNNNRSSVTLLVSGATDIETVELRTPTTLQQDVLTGDAPGVRSVLLKNEGDTPLTLELKGSTVQNLAAEGASQLTFSGADVVTMNSNGPLNVSGSGRIQNLSAGLTTGGGAADTLPAYPLYIQIQGVEIGHLNLKSPATLNVSAMVDFLAVSNSSNLGGTGSIASLTLNQGLETGRLAVDISGLSIQQLTTNTETLLYSSGSSTINVLTANSSTYALGNKVGHLKVNSGDVIFENEPDLKTIASGISPPQSKADNPNLNYSLTAVTEVTGDAVDASGDPVATTCDHAREVGGFLRGNGSKDTPFLIENAAQLAHISQHPSSHYLLAKDIDISNESSFSAGFPMICGDGARFSGVFDGGGHSVSNLRILGDGENIGLFSANTGTIRNLHLLSGEVNAGARASVGAIVGFNYQEGVVENCSNGVTVNALQSEYAGGIAGYNYGGKIRNCYNTAKIIGGSATGGIVGMNRLGSTATSVSSCYSIGVVEGSSRVGGIAGANEEAVVTNCYYLETSADYGLGEGQGSASPRTSSELSSGQTVADLSAGSDNSPWRDGSASGYAYPLLAAPDTDAVQEAAGAVLHSNAQEDSVPDSAEILSQSEADPSQEEEILSGTASYEG